MVVHNTPRQVYQSAFRRAWRRANNYEHKQFVAKMARMHKNKRIALRAAPGAYEEAIAFNKAHGIGGPENNSMRRIKGVPKGIAVKKVTMPKLKFMEGEDTNYQPQARVWRNRRKK